jgi:hypothetical protein
MRSLTPFWKKRDGSCRGWEIFAEIRERKNEVLSSALLLGEGGMKDRNRMLLIGAALLVALALAVMLTGGDIFVDRTRVK